MASMQAKAMKKRKKARRASEQAKVRGPKVKMEEIDYKNVPLLQRMTSGQGKAMSRKRTGLDAALQRQLTRALKRARFMALMPYVS
ncbi:MAG: 30S ribosomal protein S18 [Phycisphaerae bacterium]